MPIINSYKFGQMIVDGITYTRDLIITPTQVIPNWWRQEGHLLQVDDLQQQVEAVVPEILVIGTGKFGLMKVPDSVRQIFAERDIETIAQNTGSAVKTFNEISANRKVVGAFHLTC